MLLCNVLWHVCVDILDGLAHTAAPFGLRGELKMTIVFSMVMLPNGVLALQCLYQSNDEGLA